MSFDQVVNGDSDFKKLVKYDFSRLVEGVLIGLIVLSASISNLGLEMVGMTDGNDFIYRFHAAEGSPRAPLLLLHGTGGNEDDLVSLGRTLAPGAALLSPRGKVLEGSMPRFFRRLAEGVLDQADVVYRAHELADFILAAQSRYGLEKPVAVGFSNGANIAVAILLLRPEVLRGAILLRAMVPLDDPPPANLAGVPVLLVSGDVDPILPLENAKRLAAMLDKRGATVIHEVLHASHGLTQSDISLASEWLSRFAPLEN